jgi:hypothetical protein
MRTLAMVALLTAVSVPLGGCIVNQREPSRTVVREPAQPSATVVTPPSTTYVTPPPPRPPSSVTVSP